MKIVIFYLLLPVFFTLSSCESGEPPPLRIATAANAQYAMKTLSQKFGEKTGIETEVIVGSSGKLTAQIQQGAPYDVFVSADMKYPWELYNTSFTTNEPVVYAYGKLVLWTIKSDISLNMDSLSSENITHLALANPEIAPYGQAAEATLRHYHLFELLREKIVSGESIAQTNQFVLTGAAQLGFTAKSVVLAPKLQKKGRWIEVDPQSYPPIEQGAVILANAQGDENKAQAFLEYLVSDEGRRILEGFGYETTINK